MKKWKVYDARWRLRNVAIRRRFLGHTLQIFTINQALDTSLDHVDVGDEARRQLREDFVHELGVDELFALSVLLACVNYKEKEKKRDIVSQGDGTHFIIRTTAASILAPRSSFIFFSVSLR